MRLVIAALCCSLIGCAPIPTQPVTTRNTELTHGNVTALPASTKTDAISKAQLVDTYGKLPLGFEVNRGQTDDQVRFLSRGPGYSVFLTRTEAVLSLQMPKVKEQGQSRDGVAKKPSERAPLPPAGSSPQALPIASQETIGEKVNTDQNTRSRSVLRMRLVGATPKWRISGVDPLPGKVNYFRGNKPEEWRTNIPTYAKVKYEKVYPGIDLVYYSNQRQLEHDFVVAPGADPKTIRMAFAGAERLSIDGQGDLVLKTAGGDVHLRKPRVYQDINGQQREIEGHYVLHSAKRHSKTQVGFQVAAYDKAKPLIIDPVLAYSTFLGGTDFDFATSIAADGVGNVYVTGHTDSNDFPVTPGAFDTSLAGGTLKDDIFVTKFDASGSTLIYSTYLGGGDDDTGLEMAIDSAGNAYVAGVTFSSDFPSTPGTFDATRDGDRDCFVTKLNQSGGALVYSSYLGGSGFEYCYSIAVDSGNNAYVTGSTTRGSTATAFPTTAGAYDTTYNSGTPAGDGFITKFNAAGTALVYSTFLGGIFGDSGLGITLDGAGNAYVTGATGSDNFPTTSGAFDGTFNGFNSDAFVAKLNASGSALLYSTYLGGAATDEGTSIVVDGSGNAYVTGWTHSTNFPTSPGAFDPNNTGGNPNDGFITKLNATGAVLLYSTFLGGTSAECGVGIFNATGCHIAIDSLGNAYVTGPTNSSDFPTTAGALYTTHNGNTDVFLTQFNANGTGLLYSTFLGSTSSDISTGIALDTLGNVYLTGSTQQGFSPLFFPTTPGAYDTSFNGSWDAFVVKVAQAPPADLLLTQTDAPDPVFVGQLLIYTLTVTNNGPANATGVTVTDPLLGGANLVSATASQGACSGTSTNVTCGLGSLANGASATVTIVVTPISAGGRSNTASVAGDQTDPNLGDNSDTEPTTVLPPPPPAIPPIGVRPVSTCQARTCRIRLTCQDTSTACTSDIRLTVRASALKLGSGPGASAKARPRIRFAAAVVNVPPGRTDIFKLRLTPNGRKIVKNGKVKTLKGRLEVRNISGAIVSNTPITIRLTTKRRS